MTYATKVGASMAVAGVVKTLRDEILARNENGWLIGLEEELQVRLGVSRPTLRQALRVLQHEGLVEIRRGVRGGLYGRVPSADAVASIASVYLRSRNTTIKELAIAQSAISVELARMAAKSGRRAELKSWLLKQEAKANLSPRDHLELSLAFANLLADLSGNTPLALFEQVLYELALAPYDVKIFTDPDRVELIRRHQQLLADAIAEGDADTAASLIQENTTVLLNWLE